MDIKNLNNENKDSILSHILELFHEKNYPLEKVLVETRYPEALPEFSKAGFKASYYLPHSLGEMHKKKID